MNGQSYNFPDSWRDDPQFYTWEISIAKFVFSMLQNPQENFSFVFEKMFAKLKYPSYVIFNYLWNGTKNQTWKCVLEGRLLIPILDFSAANLEFNAKKFGNRLRVSRSKIDFQKWRSIDKWPGYFWKFPKWLNNWALQMPYPVKYFLQYYFFFLVPSNHWRFELKQA